MDFLFFLPAQFDAVTAHDDLSAEGPVNAQGSTSGGAGGGNCVIV